MCVVLCYYMCGLSQWVPQYTSMGERMELLLWALLSFPPCIDPPFFGCRCEKY